MSILEYKKNQVGNPKSARNGLGNSLLFVAAAALAGAEPVPGTNEPGTARVNHHFRGQGHAQVREMHSLFARSQNVRRGE